MSDMERTSSAPILDRLVARERGKAFFSGLVGRDATFGNDRVTGSSSETFSAIYRRVRRDISNYSPRECEDFIAETVDNLQGNYTDKIGADRALALVDLIIATKDRQHQLAEASEESSN